MSAWGVVEPNEPYYDAQQVCLNGHQITAFYHKAPDQRRDFCEKCGAGTIYRCPNCESEIKGRHIVPGVIGFYDTPVPEFCNACGKPYPWTKRKSESQPAKNTITETDLSPILSRLGLSPRWTLAASSLSLFELLVNKKLEELKLETSGEFHVKMTRLREAMKSDKEFPGLMVSALRDVRNKVLKAGKEPTSDELSDILKYLGKVSNSLK